MSRNARRLPTLDGRSPAHVPKRGPPQPPTERTGGRAAASTAAEGLCDRPEPKAEDAVESTDFRVAEVPEAKPEGLLCDHRRRENRPGPGGPT